MFIEKVGNLCGIKTTKEVAEALHITERAVIYKMNRGEFFSIPIGSNHFFPAFQFKNGHIIKGLGEILCILGNISPEAKCSFFLNPLFNNSKKNIADYLADYPDNFEAIRLEATFYMRMGG
jgi:hypothetical protein